MKRTLTALLALVLLVMLLPCTVSSAETVDELISQYRDAQTVDERLELIWRIAVENAKEPSGSLWQVTNKPLGNVLDGVIPEDWENYPHTVTEGFPEDAKGRRCIVIEDKDQLSARLLINFPEEMIARSVEEAEYAVVIDDHRVESGYEYTVDITTYHWDYYGYLLNLQTGEAVQFWYNRQYAGRAGFVNQLDAKPMTQDEIWEGIRDGIVNQVRPEQADGSVLIFGIENGVCYVKGYEGEPTEIVIPPEAEGYAVAGIQAGCFRGCETLKSVSLPASLKRIDDEAFCGCENLETVQFSEGLEWIGNAAFQGTALTDLVLPDTVSYIGDSAFNGCRNLVSVTLPKREGHLEIDFFAFHYSTRLSRMIVPDGVTGLSESFYLAEDGNMLYVYYPESLVSGLCDHNFNPGMIVYTPKGSYAEQWAHEFELDVVECSDPSEVPEVSYTEEGPFVFRIAGGEAQLQYYNSTGDEEVTVPAEVSGCPVTTVLSNAFDYMASSVRVIRFPATVSLLKTRAVEFSGRLHEDIKAEVYIPNPEAVLEDYSVTMTIPGQTSVTLFGEPDSAASRYAEKAMETGISGTFIFREWSGE